MTKERKIKGKEMEKERTLFQAFSLQFTVQGGVNISFSLFKFPRAISIQSTKIYTEKNIV